VIHAAFDTDVHVHVGAEAVTVTVALPASGPMFVPCGAIVKLHGAAAAWFTVKVCPAIVTVPPRGAGSVLAAMLTTTLPLPAPLPPLAIVSHGAFDVAVHEQFAVTLMVVVAASGPTVADEGAIEKLQVGAAAWFTVNVCPAIVTVPLRGDGSGLAAAATVTVPLPVPLDPLAMVSQGALLAALQLQEAADAVTVTVAFPASAPRLAFGGAIVKVHGGGGVADCVIVNVRPATVKIPDRSAPLLAATVNPTVMSALPLVVFSVIHGTLLDAVHAQPACAASTRSVALPPDEPKFCVDAVTVNVHGSAA
jgi:hypothetical protein